MGRGGEFAEPEREHLFVDHRELQLDACARRRKSADATRMHDAQIRQDPRTCNDQGHVGHHHHRLGCVHVWPVQNVLDSRAADADSRCVSAGHAARSKGHAAPSRFMHSSDCRDGRLHPAQGASHRRRRRRRRRRGIRLRTAGLGSWAWTSTVSGLRRALRAQGEAEVEAEAEAEALRPWRDPARSASRPQPRTPAAARGPRSLPAGIAFASRSPWQLQRHVSETLSPLWGVQFDQPTNSRRDGRWLGWCLRGEDAAARLRAMAEPSNRRIHSWHWLNKHVLARCHAAESTKAQVKVSGGVGGVGSLAGQWARDFQRCRQHRHHPRASWGIGAAGRPVLRSSLRPVQDWAAPCVNICSHTRAHTSLHDFGMPPARPALPVRACVRAYLVCVCVCAWRAGS